MSPAAPIIVYEYTRCGLASPELLLRPQGEKDIHARDVIKRSAAQQSGGQRESNRFSHVHDRVFHAHVVAFLIIFDVSQVCQEKQGREEGESWRLGRQMDALGDAATEGGGVEWGEMGRGGAKA